MLGDRRIFTKNRECLIALDVTAAFLERILKEARDGKLLSDAHLTVDGTTIEVWASLKSFRRNGAPPHMGGSGAARKSIFMGTALEPNQRLQHQPGGAAFSQTQMQRVARSVLRCLC
jgi:hypothetical protein